MPRLDVPAILAALEPAGVGTESTSAETRFLRLVGLVLGVDGQSPLARLEIALGDAGLSSIEELAQASLVELLELVHPFGASARKRAPVLRKFALWVSRRGDLESLAALPSETLREQLHMIPGLGLVTVEAMLLFGFDRPAYPLDRATFRILFRHGWVDSSDEPEAVRDLLIDAAQANPVMLRQLSERFDQIGRVHCRVRRALCQQCPLAPWLPETGPYQADD